MNTYSKSVIIKRVHMINKGKPFTMYTFPSFINLFKIPALTQKACFGKPKVFQQNQADKRFRPLALRVLIMARPARVRMRARNPWERLRFKLLG